MSYEQLNNRAKELISNLLECEKTCIKNYFILRIEEIEDEL